MLKRIICPVKKEFNFSLILTWSCAVGLLGPLSFVRVESINALKRKMRYILQKKQRQGRDQNRVAGLGMHFMVSSLW